MNVRNIMLTLALCAACAGSASALEYTMEAPKDYLFAKPTSVEVVHGIEESRNVDRSKSVALIPPWFGSPTSCLPGSGEYLTPNLVPGALSGGLVNQVGSVNYPIEGSYIQGYAERSGTEDSSYPASDLFTASYLDNGASSVSYTDVNENLYYSGGYLGTLKIPAIDVNVKVYQGTDSNQLAKGAGHFKDTSIWDGNVALAGHNRGSHGIFGEIHTLEIGDTMTYTTKLGTRTYEVTSVKKVSETDNDDLAETAGNCLTLYTCVRDQREFRWCVRAVER